MVLYKRLHPISALDSFTTFFYFCLDKRLLPDSALDSFTTLGYFCLDKRLHPISALDTFTTSRSWQFSTPYFWSWHFSTLALYKSTHPFLTVFHTCFLTKVNVPLKMLEILGKKFPEKVIIKIIENNITFKTDNSVKNLEFSQPWNAPQRM